MLSRIAITLALIGVFVAASLPSPPAHACCAVSMIGKPVVNADQNVIIIWDAASKTQHFIRRASFKSEADDFGFLVPSPTQPELSESGNEAFPFLGKLTAPTVITLPRTLGGGCGCAAAMHDAPAAGHGLWVKVLEEKVVAGFHAAVLETNSSADLVKWLKDNGYNFSPEVEAWAKPYVDAGWKITALKVAKDKDEKDKKTVAASALRMTFKTDRPLFPYREPDYKHTADRLDVKRRLLRIYFLAEARYQGDTSKAAPWTGKAVWSGKIGAADRQKILDQLQLPATTGPAQWWLTEFEDNWSYQLAPADIIFSRAADQSTLKRPTERHFASATYPTDASACALAAALIVPPVWLRLRRRWRA